MRGSVVSWLLVAGCLNSENLTIDDIGFNSGIRDDLGPNPSGAQATVLKPPSPSDSVTPLVISDVVPEFLDGGFDPQKLPHGACLWIGQDSRVRASWEMWVQGHTEDGTTGVLAACTNSTPRARTDAAYVPRWSAFGFPGADLLLCPPEDPSNDDCWSVPAGPCTALQPDITRATRTPNPPYCVLGASTSIPGSGRVRVQEQFGDLEAHRDLAYVQTVDRPRVIVRPLVRDFAFEEAVRATFPGSVAFAFNSTSEVFTDEIRTARVRVLERAGGSTRLVAPTQIAFLGVRSPGCVPTSGEFPEYNATGCPILTLVTPTVYFGGTAPPDHLKWDFVFDETAIAPNASMTVEFTIMPKAPMPGLAVAPDWVDLGTVPALHTSRARRAVEVANVGDKPLTVTAIEVSGADAGAFEVVTRYPVPFDIGPADTERPEIRVTPDREGRFEALVTVRAKDGNGNDLPPGTARLAAGGAAPYLEVVPNPVIFQRGVTRRNVVVLNIGALPWTIETLRPSLGFEVDPSLIGLQVDSGDILSVPVDFRPDPRFPMSEYSGTLTVETSSGLGETITLVANAPEPWATLEIAPGPDLPEDIVPEE